MERINQALRLLKERFDIGDFPHLSAMSKDDWREYYDIESAKLVYKIYKKRHTYRQQ